MTRSPQNWSPDTELVWTSQVRRPPGYAATAMRTQTAAQSRGCRAARGGEPTVRHGCQEAALRVPHPDEEEKLGGTAHEGDGLLLPEEVTEHLRGYGGGIREVNDGQVTEEEIHGGVEV